MAGEAPDGSHSARAAGSALREQLTDARNRQAWTEAARELTTELLAGSEPAQVRAHLVDHVGRLTRSAQVLLGWIDEANSADTGIPAARTVELVVDRCAGDASDHLGRRLPLDDDSLVARALARPGPVPVTDIRHTELVDLLPAAGPALLLPLHAPDAVLGVLITARPLGDPPYDDGILGLATVFTDQVAVAMRLAQTQRRMRDLDVLTDRDRIAHDLHDHVIQRLFAIGLALQATTARTEVPEVRAQLTDTINDLQEVVQEIRTAIVDLHGGDARSTRLRQRFERAVREPSGGSGVRTALRVTGPLSVVAPDLADAAETRVREAVGSVAQAAGTATIDVAIDVGDDLVVTVTGDGATVLRWSAPLR